MLKPIKALVWASNEAGQDTNTYTGPGAHEITIHALFLTNNFPLKESYGI